MSGVLIKMRIDKKKKRKKRKTRPYIHPIDQLYQIEERKRKSDDREVGIYMIGLFALILWFLFTE